MRTNARIALGALCCALAWPLGAQAVDTKVQNGITYVTGGVGLDESQAMQSMAKNYSLRILTAAQSGEYLADVNIGIHDEQGRRLLSLTTEGPYLLVRLAPGRYRVDAEYGQARQSRQVQVRAPASGGTQVQFYF